MSSTPRVSTYNVPPLGRSVKASSSAARTARPVRRVTISLPPTPPPATPNVPRARPPPGEARQSLLQRRPDRPARPSRDHQLAPEVAAGYLEGGLRPLLRRHFRPHCRQ